MTEKTKTITERLSRIQKALKAPKSQNNTFGKYKYRNCEDILESLKPLLQDDETVNISDEIVYYGQNPSMRKTKGPALNEAGEVIGEETIQTVYGERFYVKATATFRCGNDTISSTAFAREPFEKKGMDASQVTGATSSYARKYALNGLLLIDDTKDADATNTGKDEEVKDASKVEKEEPKINWKSVQMNICNGMEMCKSIPELDALMEKSDADIQAMPQEFADFISDKYHSLKEGGFSEKPKIKLASVKDALDAWEKMQAKLLTLQSLQEIKEWIIKITPYLDEMDRLLTADKYKNDRGQTPRQELEDNIDFHSKTILSRQG